jgi:hypothetical protein
MVSISSTSYANSVNYNKNQQKLGFGTANTTAERKLLGEFLATGLKRSDIDILALNLPVAAAPAKHAFTDTGIGNFTDVANSMIKAKQTTGVNTALFLPLGSSYDPHNSPFSSDGFGLNHGFLDPLKLVSKTYGKLLERKSPEDRKVLSDLYKSPKSADRTQYSNMGKLEAIMDRAFANYQAKLSQGDKGALALQKEFGEFKQQDKIKYWLPTYAKTKSPQNPENYEFKQFLLHKQYDEMKGKLKKNGIDTIVDIPVGANRDLDKQLEKDNPFLGRELGAFDGAQGKWVGWGITPLDPGKESARNLAYQKARYHASLGDGARLDCFNGNMFAADGNGVLPEYQANHTILADQLFWGLKHGGVDPKKSFAEHLPYNAPYDTGKVDSYLRDKSREILGDSIPKLSVMKWTHFREESFNSNGSHEIGGYHQDHPGDRGAIKNGFVDLLSKGSRRAMLPVTDAYDLNGTYNVSNTVNDTNWTKRIPAGSQGEAHYHGKLQDGFGFNGPEVIAETLNRKGKNDGESNHLKAVLSRFGQKLREQGPKTEAEANKQFGPDYVDPQIKSLIGMK